MRARRIFSKIPGSPRLWLMLFTIFFLASGFFEIVDDVFQDPMEADYESHIFDKNAAAFFQQFRSEKLTQIAVDLTALGSISVLTVFTLFGLAVTLGRRDYWGFVHMSVALLGSALWTVLLKEHFARPRPDLVDHLVKVGDLSFPSGHSFGAAAAYATFAFFGARYVQKIPAEILSYTFAALVIGLVGVTRIYLGVHYASDVLAGFCAGGAWAFFLAAIFSFIYRQQARSSK